MKLTTWLMKLIRGEPMSRWLMSHVSLSNLIDVAHGGVAHEPLSRSVSHPAIHARATKCFGA